MHILKRHVSLIYYVYLFFIFLLLLEKMHWFCIDTIECTKGYLTTIWSVQTCISVLAITMIAITMAYNETKVYGRTVREIVFYRKAEKINMNTTYLKWIEIIQCIVIIGINIFLIYKVSIKNPNDTMILWLVLIGTCFYIYMGEKRYTKPLEKDMGWIVIFFVLVIKLRKIENVYLVIVMMFIVLVEIIFTRKCITYYDRILVAIIFIPMCGYFVLKVMNISTIVIGISSVINIAYLIHYSVEYILDYEKFKQNYRQEIKTICAKNIEKENEEINNE